MKYLLLIFLTFMFKSVEAQHWPTHQFQHDTIYKNAAVKSFKWKSDSTRRFVDYEAELDRNGHIVQLEYLGPTINYSYNEEGVLVGENHWADNTIISHDTLNRVVSKITYTRDSIMTKNVSISYDPKIISDTEYENDGHFKIKRVYYFDTETTVEEYVVETPYLYGELRYNYVNEFNDKGQIIHTTNLTLPKQATYKYLENGLLETITITDALGTPEGTQTVVEHIIYTYY